MISDLDRHNNNIDSAAVVYSVYWHKSFEMIIKKIDNNFHRSKEFWKLSWLRFGLTWNKNQTELFLDWCDISNTVFDRSQIVSVVIPIDRSENWIEYNVGYLLIVI